MELYLCGFTAYYNIEQEKQTYIIHVILEDKTTPVKCEYNLRLSFIDDNQTHDPEAAKLNSNSNFVAKQKRRRRKSIWMIFWTRKFIVNWQKREEVEGKVVEAITGNAEQIMVQ